MWNDELTFALHQNHLIRARPNQQMIIPRWLVEYMNSDSGRAQLLGKSKTSSGLHNINSQVVASLRVPLPPLPEQQEIASILSGCDAKIAALEREMALHEELFGALLEDFMSGRLSVQPLLENVAA
jgi:type I restriction enzyme, S subunit